MKTDHHTAQRVRELAARGHSNKEISAELGITLRMVVYHIQKLFRLAGLYGCADQRRFMVWLLTEGKTPEAPSGQHGR